LAATGFLAATVFLAATAFLATGFLAAAGFAAVAGFFAASVAARVMNDEVVSVDILASPCGMDLVSTVYTLRDVCKDFFVLFFNKLKGV
jgi:hypothetical protein